MIKPTKVQVRFSDIDVMGHVNNAVYLSYFELARMDYFKQLVGVEWDWKSDGIILLKNEVEYIKPVLMKDEPLISISVLKVGGKSFELGYELTVNEKIYAKGKSTLVCFNYKSHSTMEIPEILRNKLKALIVE